MSCLGGINSIPVPATPNTSVIAELTPSLSEAFKIIKSTPEVSLISILAVSYTHLTLPTKRIV